MKPEILLREISCGSKKCLDSLNTEQVGGNSRNFIHKAMQSQKEGNKSKKRQKEVDCGGKLLEKNEKGDYGEEQSMCYGNSFIKNKSV